MKKLELPPPPTFRLFDVPPSTSPRRLREAQQPGAESDHWFSPMKIFAPLHKRLRFTVDAAGHAEAPVTQAIGKWFDITQDGLRQDYRRERVWCNPPYSNIEPWAEIAPRSILAGAELWAMLLPVWTDRAWWHDFIEPHRRTRATGVRVTLRFIRGRVRYGFPGNPEGLGGQGGGFDASVIVIFRPRR